MGEGSPSSSPLFTRGFAPIVILDEPDVRRLLHYRDLIPAIARALADLSAGRLQGRGIHTLVLTSRGPEFRAATERELAQAFSSLEAIRAHPNLVLGLATGRTQTPVYAALRRMHAAGEVDFTGVTTFNLDEFVGLAASRVTDRAGHVEPLVVVIVQLGRRHAEAGCGPAALRQLASAPGLQQPCVLPDPQ